ncbi:ead/Ea22-like family protein [Salmonella enterica]
MSNIDKQAVTAKTKELASFMVERFSMNPVSCKLLNEAWEKEFPDEVAIAERMLALLDENLQLQREKDAIEAVALALRDDMRQAREQLKAAEERYEDMLRQARSFREAHDYAAEIIRKLERNKPTVTLPTTRLWAGKVACYEECEIREILRAAGIGVKGE